MARSTDHTPDFKEFAKSKGFGVQQFTADHYRVGDLDFWTNGKWFNTSTKVSGKGIESFRQEFEKTYGVLR